MLETIPYFPVFMFKLCERFVAAMHEYAALSNVDVSESEEELFETTSFMKHNSTRVEEPVQNSIETRTHNHSPLPEEDVAADVDADVEDFAAVEADDTEDLFAFR